MRRNPIEETSIERTVCVGFTVKNTQDDDQGHEQVDEGNSYPDTEFQRADRFSDAGWAITSLCRRGRLRELDTSGSVWWYFEKSWHGISIEVFLSKSYSLPRPSITVAELVSFQPNDVLQVFRLTAIQICEV